MTSVKSFRSSLDQKKGQKRQLEQRLIELQEELTKQKRNLRQHEQAREIIRTVGMATQQQIQVNISDITSLALEAVFEDPYELKVEFVQRRNKTECDLYFVREEQMMDPLTAAGGGAVDVAAFALRIASWSMALPKTRNTIILDEPMRFLSADNQEKASAMLKEISRKLGVQFIIVTHEPALAAYGDKIFQVSKKNNVSQVKVI